MTSQQSFPQIHAVTGRDTNSFLYDVWKIKVPKSVSMEKKNLGF